MTGDRSMLCVTLEHKKGCFSCTLKHLLAEITQLPVSAIPRHWIYNCRNPQLSIAVTTKNAIEIRRLLELGMPVDRERLGWHVQFNGNRHQMLAALRREGY